MGLAKCPETGLDIYVDGNGYERRLGCLPSDTAEAAALPNASDVVPLIDQSLWTENEVAMLIDMILNQHSHGSCVGFSDAGGEQTVRWSRGELMDANGKFIKLSGSYPYSWINGGFDGGASIIAAMSATQQHGTCTDAECPWDVIYRGQTQAFDASAALRKMGQGVRVNDWATFCSLLQRGIPVQFGCQVSGNFGSFDSEGCHGYGGSGSNHSVFAWGMKKKADGTWKARLVNSWGASWGPYSTGTCYTDQRRFESGGGGFAHVDTIVNPNDPNAPPAIV